MEHHASEPNPNRIDSVADDHPDGFESGNARVRDRKLAALAERQHGPVSRSQLEAIGFNQRLIEDRSGRSLWPVAPSVYAVGHPGLSRRGRGNAALLHAGADASLSLESAARVWEVRPNERDGPIHVSVRNRSDIAEVPGIKVHRPRNLAEEEIVVHRGFRVTTPERTLIDLLPSLSVAEVTRVLEQMVTRLNRSPDDLHAWAHQLKGVNGKRKLIEALDEVAGPAVIKSELETLFRTVCQEGGLPPALTNYPIGRWELDAVWLEYGVAVELDSYRFHGGKWQFYRDRRKGLAVSRAGFELLRVSWPQLKRPRERPGVVEAVQYALDRGTARKRA